MSYDANSGSSKGSDFSSVGFRPGLLSTDGVNEGASANSPIGELIRAMVLRVVDDVRAGGHLREDALAYMDAAFLPVAVKSNSLHSNTDEEYLLSFKNVAAYLGVCPQKLKVAILDPERSISTRRRAA